jgi:Transposase IS116/IS110/IS902 family/Transposase
VGAGTAPGPPSRWKAVASARLKNDKVDARTLAQLLRADLLPEAWIAPPEIGDLRALLRHRASLARLATGLKNRVHAVLADRGITPPSSRWATPGRAWLQALELPPTPRAIIDDCCGVLDTLARPIARLEREIAALAKPDPRVQALMALPGVGKLTAMTLLAEIGDIGRFPTAPKLCAWAGLTPQVRNLRPQGPPRPPHQAGLAVGALDPAGGCPDGQAEPTVRRHLRPAGPPPGHQHRHRGARPAAAGPQLPYPDPAGGSTGTGEGQ